jgi:hypothetical protein
LLEFKNGVRRLAATGNSKNTGGLATEVQMEGGYALGVLEECVEDHVRMLLGIPYDHF